MAKPVWQQEFGDEYRVPDWTAQPGVEDQSWHNDACPSFWRPGTEVVLWVEHPDPAKRESGPNENRFTFGKVDREHGFVCDASQVRTSDEGIARTTWEWVARENPSFESLRGWVAARKHYLTPTPESDLDEVGQMMLKGVYQALDDCEQMQSTGQYLLVLSKVRSEVDNRMHNAKDSTPRSNEA